jgi:hypothetical protein
MKWGMPLEAGTFYFGREPLVSQCAEFVFDAKSRDWNGSPVQAFAIIRFC